MSGEDPEDKKVENPAADDDSIDDDSLEMTYSKLMRLLTLTVILRLIRRLLKQSLRWLKHQTAQLEKQPVNSQLSMPHCRIRYA